MMLARVVLLAAVSLVACTASNTGSPIVPVVAPESNERDRQNFAHEQGLSLGRFDLNRDGKPDIFKYTRFVDDPTKPGEKVEQLARKEIDINFDGKVDIIRIYDPAGKVVEELLDLDFDGKVDERSLSPEGVLARKEIDLNYDTKPDLTKFYDKGKLLRIEADSNLDGRVETWEYYEDGVLDRIGTDKDGDGIVDVWDKKRIETQEAAADAAPEAPVPPTPETKK